MRNFQNFYDEKSTNCKLTLYQQKLIDSGFRSRSSDSNTVISHPSLFFVDARGRPEVIGAWLGMVRLDRALLRMLRMLDPRAQEVEFGPEKAQIVGKPPEVVETC